MSKDNLNVRYTAMICFGLIGLIIWIFFRMTMGTEEPKEPINISVVLYHTQSNGWESLQEGMKQAEDDFSVNINYVIMREGADGEEQLATIEREIEGGAQGILLAVCDYEALYAPFNERKFEVPIIAVESGMSDSTIPLISADNYAMGKSLGEEILKDFEGRNDLKIAIAKDTVKRDSVQQRRQGLEDALEGKAQIVPLSMAADSEIVDAVVALHKDMLLMLTGRADALWEKTQIYGIGNTASTVAALDQGKIRKLIFQNEFNMGYLGVETLLGEINNAGNGDIKEIDYYCVSRQELYGTQYEQLLFPIVE